MAKVQELTYSLNSLFVKYRDDNLLAKLENYALWTIPSVFTKDEDLNYQNKSIEYDCQSIGAGLVNRLATRLASTLFPANTSFFKIEISPEIKEVLDKQKVANVIALENKACDRLFLNASYAQLVQAMRLLIITGDIMLYRVNEALRVYSLRDYTLKRNHLGDVMDIIIQEHKYWDELEPRVQLLIGSKPNDNKLKVYTRVRLVEKGAHKYWQLTQEINGRDIGTDVTYPDKLCPYIPVTWNYVNGDNYGRSYVEDYAADLYKLSTLSAALADYQFESMRVIYLVNPQGQFDTESAEKASTGDFINGSVESVSAFEAGDANKIQQIMLSLGEIEQRLNVAFMYMGNTREGERVTAYEISQNAMEAENVLGGVYSQLSQHMHLPLAYLLLHEENELIINDIKRNNITLNILTGLQALSRSSESQALTIAASALNAIIPSFTNLGLSAKWNIDAIAEMVLNSHGVNVADLQYTEEELAQIQAQQKEQQAQEQMQAATAGQGGGQLQGQESAVDAYQTSMMG